MPTERETIMASLDEVINNATSDEVDIDFSSAVSFEALPKDRYLLEIESVESGMSKPKADAPQGNPKLVWKFVVVDGEHAGRVVFRHSPTTGKGSGLTKDVLRALGVGSLDSPQVKFKMSSAVGQRVYADVQPQSDNDKYSEITSLYPYTPAAPVDL
jgi:hypothetical protein